MDAERWQEIKNFLDLLAEATRSERSHLLRDLQHKDPALSEEVQSYLHYGEAAESFINEPIWQLIHDTASGAPSLSAHAAPPPPANGETTETRIGPYRLKELLGRGGMGQVHLAVREDDYEQKVAIKQALGPMVNSEMQARFAKERQILANLQHPDIARLLDGGTDQEGMPYFVMEYVEGEPITDYCDHHDLDLRQRLKLFRKVCRAVHFAHQRLVVHRDLKAGNILVTADGKPKLLDFGIAKLLEDSTDSDLTSDGRVPLTPSSASPEQLMGEPITTAADVYALGLLLYELLAGVKPYEVSRLDYAALIRCICLKEPPKPSLAVGTRPGSEPTSTDSTEQYPNSKAPFESPDAFPGNTAGENQPAAAEAKALQRRRRQLKGDLDALVMKAIRKEPRHRYDSAADLADDVLNYLQGLPVQARKGSWLYHMGKHLQRNRPALVVLLLIVALAVTSTVMWQMAKRREAQALAAEAETRAMNDFLTDMLESANPDESKGEELTVKEVLMASQDRIAASLSSFPDRQIAMYDVFAGVFYDLKAREESLQMYQRSLDTLRHIAPEPSSRLALRIANVGSGYYGLRDYRAAEKHYEMAFAMRKQIGIPRSKFPISIGNLASCHLKLGKYPQARQGFEEVLQIRLKDPASTPSQKGSAYHGLGTFLNSIEAYGQAIEPLEYALEFRLQAAGELHSTVATTLSALGTAHLGNGDPKTALEVLHRTLTIQQELYGAHGNSVGITHRLLAEAHLAGGSIDEADRQVDTALEILRPLRAPGSWEVVNAEIIKGRCLTRQGAHREAEVKLLKALASLHAQPYPLKVHILRALRALVDLYDAAGLDEKARLYRAELATYKIEA